MTKDRAEVIAYWSNLAALHAMRAMEHRDYEDELGYEMAREKQELARDCMQLVFLKRGLIELVL